jgi:hypothetical protein
MKKGTITQSIVRYVIPRLGEIFFAAIFAAAIALGPQMMNVDGDLGRHLALGNYIVETRTIPTNDVFSFTKLGEPLTPHEWLADVLFSLAHKAAGLDGVVWLTALIIGVSYWLVYKHSVSLGNMSVLALLGGILGAGAGSLHWLTRPHIFTILFTAIWVIELEKVRIGLKRSWIIFPVLMLVWTNLHGAFIVGLVIWATVLLGELFEKGKEWDQIRTLIWIGPSSLLASLINPDGLGIWKTGIGFLGNQYLVSHTAEYLPPDFQSPAFWPFLLLISLSVLILGLYKGRMRYAHIFLLGSWTAMALYSARNIPLYIVVTIPLLCDLGARIIKDGRDIGIAKRFLSFQEKLSLTEMDIRGGVISIIIVLGSILLLINGAQLDFQNEGNTFSEEIFPVQAVDWMENNEVRGNGFNHFPWGGYLLYRLWPDQLVFIDGQTDFYGEELTRKYEEVITMKPGWQQILEEYDIQWVLVPSYSRLAKYYIDQDGWENTFSDQTAKLFIKLEEK